MAGDDQEWPTLEPLATEFRCQVYVLRDPRTKQIHYVGVTVNPYQRYLAHVARPSTWDKSPRSEWVRSLLALGLKPEMCLIETVGDADPHDAEERWIAFFERAGQPITNTVRRKVRDPSPKKGRGWSVPDSKEISIALLFERGCFGYGNGRANHVSLSINPCHRRMLEALVFWLGGSIYGPYKAAGNSYLSWRVYGEDLLRLIETLDALLSPGARRDHFEAWRSTWRPPRTKRDPLRNNCGYYTEVCPSSSGYARHRYRKEEPCDMCACCHAKHAYNHKRRPRKQPEEEQR